ncbi:MAG: hypothetical protein KA536_15795 [Saprospiraceae bacterium]|nr:hypothetical protein [Saprospiraceae bacterium]
MLFNLSFFRNELLDSPDKSQDVKDYEKFVETIPADIRELKPYKEFISSFTVPDIEYCLPHDIETDFDYDLLIQMLAASFSTEIDFLYNSNLDKYEVMIHVNSSGISVKKSLSELWGFQILTLFEINTLEQINLQFLIQTDDNERNDIVEQRNIIKNEYNEKMIDLEIQRKARKFSDAVCDMLDTL